MTCTVCGDKGILRLKYHGGEPDEFAICQCAAGQAWRCEQNGHRRTYPLWHVWAAREQVEHERIGLIEEFFENSELARMFPQVSAVAARGVEDELIAAGRQRRGRL